MSDQEFVDWVPKESAAIPPPQPTLRWVEAQVDDTVSAVVQLFGGLSSAVHRIELASKPSVVLRRYTLGEWMAREPQIPHDEARNLALLASLDLGVTTPMLVAADPDGVECDVPALVMTEVSGQPVIDPVDPIGWAERLAECLAGIHQQPPVHGLPRYHPWNEPNRPAPIWTTDPDMWSLANAKASVDMPAHPDSFLHRDFHPNNIHWVNGEICAVVDWLGACNGPIAGDLAHCRWNIAMLCDAALAEHFTEHYRLLTGYSEDMLWFDLSTVLSGPVGPFPTHAWNSLGRSDLTSDTVAVKIDHWLRLLLDAG